MSRERLGMVKARKKVPAYLLAFLALLGGIAAGGSMPETLAPVAAATRWLLELLILLVPALILAAVSPAIATLIRRGLAGRFAAAVLLWFLLTTAAAAFVGIVISAVAFPFGLSTGGEGSLARAVDMLRELGSAGFTAVPVLAIFGSVVLGVVGSRWEWPYRALKRVESAVAKLGSSLGYAMAPLILALGIMIGVTFGAQLAISHYGTIVVYAAAMSVIWCLVYLFALRFLGGVRAPWRLLKEYFFPTALFAAGTSSSLATIPVNLAAAKRYGVRDEVADFVIPLGAVVHKDASAMQYMAYAAFIAGHVFGLEINWSLLILVSPVVVIYTMASPGIPGAMGLGLWTAVLFASLLGLDEPFRSTFVGTWIALTSGIPDMFRTAGNATGEGFTTVIFSHNFDRYFGSDQSRVTGSPAARLQGRPATPPRAPAKSGDR